jgi:hypothetical protein
MLVAYPGDSALLRESQEYLELETNRFQDIHLEYVHDDDDEYIGIYMNSKCRCTSEEKQ